MNIILLHAFAVEDNVWVNTDDISFLRKNRDSKCTEIHFSGRRYYDTLFVQETPEQILSFIPIN